VIEVRWRKTPSTRRREVLVPDTGATEARPIRSESRSLLVASIARGRRWLKELMTDPQSNAETIAGRERCSVRKINKTISLAFFAPDLVKAAIDGRLRYGLGVARLCDLPAEWSRQRQMLGSAAAHLPPNTIRRAQLWTSTRPSRSTRIMRTHTAGVVSFTINGATLMPR
jgi:site-specific DNA recombinase